MRSPRTTAFVGLMLSVLTLNGCDGTLVSERSAELAGSLWSPAETGVPSAEAKNVEVDLYVDGSQSMAGFAGGATPTKFDNVLDKITFTVGLDSLYRFGEFSGGYFERFPASAAMRQPAFYNRSHNPDQRLFERILADTTGRAFIYVTDGVLSDQQGLTQASVVGQLKDHLSGGGGLGLLVFRSAFRGRAWSEQRQQWVGDVDVPDRPFYLMLVAPSKEALTVVFTKLGALKFDAAQVYRFDADAVSCEPAIARGIPVEERNPKRRWAMLKMDDVVRDAKPDRLLTYTCDVAEDFPLTNFAADLSATLYRWDAAADKFGPSQPSSSSVVLRMLRDEAISEGRKSSVPVATEWDFKGAGYSFVALHADAPIGVRRPALDTLSTDSDADPSAFNRTYRIGWLVEELARHQVQRPEASLPLFLTIEH